MTIIGPCSLTSPMHLIAPTVRLCSRRPASAFLQSSLDGILLFLSTPPIGEHTIHSCCGVQQGDPLGPLGFTLTLHPIIERIQLQLPDLSLNVWYLDDGALSGSARDLAATIQIIEHYGPPAGLHLNRSKSGIYPPWRKLFEVSPSSQYTHYSSWFHHPRLPSWAP